MAVVSPRPQNLRRVARAQELEQFGCFSACVRSGKNIVLVLPIVFFVETVFRQAGGPPHGHGMHAMTPERDMIRRRDVKG